MNTWYAPAELTAIVLSLIVLIAIVLKILYFAAHVPMYEREPLGYGCKYVKYLLKQRTYYLASFAVFIFSMGYFTHNYDHAELTRNTWDVALVSMSAAFMMASSFALLFFSWTIIFGDGDFMDRECEMQGIVGDPRDVWA